MRAGVYVLAVLIALLAWRWVIERIFAAKEFTDEAVNTQAAIHLVRDGNYTAPGILGGDFDPAITTGFASTWPTAVANLFSERLEARRLALALVAWAHLTALGWVFARRTGLDNAGAALVAATTWLATVHVPYGQLFLQNLGELSGALWLATGLLFLRARPALAGLCWGIASWGCKLIYLPMAGVFGLAYLVSARTSLRSRLGAGLRIGFAFLVPLAAWLGAIALHSGPRFVPGWLQSYFAFVVGLDGVGGAPPVRGLWERLHSRDLGYPTSWLAQVRIAGLLGLPLAVTLGHLVRSLRRAAQPPLAYRVAGSGLLLLYAVWYFLWHHSMAIRYLQPALYLGLGWLVVEIVLLLAPLERRFLLSHGGPISQASRAEADATGHRDARP